MLLLLRQQKATQAIGHYTQCKYRERTAMNITWKDLFNLANALWGINDAKIADLLGVHPSTISKLKSGKQETFNKSYEELYYCLFDPEKIEDRPLRERPEILINDLKREIRTAGLEIPEKLLSQTQYKDFVIELLKLVKNPPHTKDNGSTPHSTPSQNQPLMQSDNFSSLNSDGNVIIPIPNECKKCLYCSNWEGSVENAYKCKEGVYGNCIVYSKNFLSSDKSCNRFSEAYGRIIQYQFSKMYENFQSRAPKRKSQK